jgi:hypothetical protein
VSVEAAHGAWWSNARRGFFGHGDMQKEFEDAAFKLNKGEVSGVVDTASGLHLIQRLATHPALCSMLTGANQVRVIFQLLPNQHGSRQPRSAIYDTTCR